MKYSRNGARLEYKYSPDQDRDERGRFGSGNGGGNPIPVNASRSLAPIGESGPHAAMPGAHIDKEISQLDAGQAREALAHAYAAQKIGGVSHPVYQLVTHLSGLTGRTRYGIVNQGVRDSRNVIQNIRQ